MFYIAGVLVGCLTEIGQYYDFINEFVRPAVQNAAVCRRLRREKLSVWQDSRRRFARHVPASPPRRSGTAASCRRRLPGQS